ncbi:MAG: FAD-binding oxidoreductase [Pseudomonadota bacterium]
MLTPQPHTGSYYAATVGDKTDYPVLNDNRDTDVCVIGAGFSGVSTALHLAERGFRVVVVEANKVGWGASGRNGGQLIGGIAGEQAMAKHHGRDVEELFGELRWEGHRIIRERVEKYAIDCDLKSGYIDVAIKPKHVRDLEWDYERMQKADFPWETRLLSKSETEDLIGTDAYIGGLLNMCNGHLHPLKLCVGEARAAESLGVEIYEQSPVVRIEHGCRPTVYTAAGSVSADFVVLAGNAYHDVEKPLRGSLFPVKSFLIVTEPLPDDVVQRINPNDLAVCDPNFVLEYFRLTADKRMMFGGRINYFGSDPEYIKVRLRKKMLRIYPGLERFNIDYAWDGTIGVTMSRVPVLGRTAPNVLYCQGYSGHGVNVTHLVSRIVADAIQGTLEQFDVFADVPSQRIPGAYTLRKPMVALGVLYYKLRDGVT